MKPTFRPPSKMDTWAEVAGEYFDDGTALVDYDDDRVCLCGYEVVGRGDIMGFMTDSEIAEMEDRLTEEVNTMAADLYDGYGDYLYEQAKDRRLGL